MPLGLLAQAHGLWQPLQRHLPLLSILALGLGKEVKPVPRIKDLSCRWCILQGRRAPFPLFRSALIPHLTRLADVHKAENKNAQGAIERAPRSALRTGMKSTHLASS